MGRGQEVKIGRRQEVKIGRGQEVNTLEDPLFFEDVLSFKELVLVAFLNPLDFPSPTLDEELPVILKMERSRRPRPFPLIC